jgi:hypothetical protein
VRNTHSKEPPSLTNVKRERRRVRKRASHSSKEETTVFHFFLRENEGKRHPLGHHATVAAAHASPPSSCSKCFSVGKTKIAFPSKLVSPRFNSTHSGTQQQSKIQNKAPRTARPRDPATYVLTNTHTHTHTHMYAHPNRHRENGHFIHTRKGITTRNTGRGARWRSPKDALGKKEANNSGSSLPL